MNSMNGSWSLSACCGRAVPRRRPSSFFAAFGSGAGLGVAFVALADGAFGDGAFVPPRLRGGGEVGAGIGPDAAREVVDDGPRLRDASRVACRLFGPRTGVRSTKIQPTPGT